MPAAVVLLSGGLDSSVALGIARSRGFSCLALTVRYGQRHALEVEAAAAVARALGAAEHRVVGVDLKGFGGSALTAGRGIPKRRTPGEIGQGIPATYVPARNTVLLSLALAWAEAAGASDLFLGVNALDYSGYPDCRPEFLAAFERLAALATKAGVEGRPFRIHAPLLRMTKAEIVLEGTRLGLDLSLTHSCYDPPAPGLHCGACDACLLRRKGFREARVPDPTRYAG